MGRPTGEGQPGLLAKAVLACVFTANRCIYFPRAIPSRLEVIALRVEAMASRLEAIAIRLEVIASHGWSELVKQVSLKIYKPIE